jgi:NAD(P)H-hydrate repair Nnr-like enzyme with NAD(P)H-hydrate epimerase domain
MTTQTPAAPDCSTALLSAAQMAQADRCTVEGGISSIALMENAGRPVAQAIMQRWAPRASGAGWYAQAST